MQGDFLAIQPSCRGDDLWAPNGCGVWRGNSGIRRTARDICWIPLSRDEIAAQSGPDAETAKEPAIAGYRDPSQRSTALKSRKRKGNCIAVIHRRKGLRRRRTSARSGPSCLVCLPSCRSLPGPDCASKATGGVHPCKRSLARVPKFRWRKRQSCTTGLALRRTESDMGNQSNSRPLARIAKKLTSDTAAPEA